ncbi:mCG146856 [Mus musculus]|nr:mCG146856 [Mus musculus]
MLKCLQQHRHEARFGRVTLPGAPWPACRAEVEVPAAQ